MADHLDLLRMQFPPLIALLGRLAKALPLDTLAAIHLLAAIAGTAVLGVGVAITRRLGGGREAQVLAALALAVGPFSLRTGALFQPVVFEVLWWSLAALAFVALLDGGDRRWWIVFGIAAGLGGLTKFSAAIFGAAMALGVIASPLRRDLRTRWPWIAVLVGGLIASPSVLGQIHWDWPFLAQQQMLRESQLDRVTPGSFLSGQLLLVGAAAPLLLAGAIGLFASASLRRFRAVGIAAAAAIAFLLMLHGKEYYFGPMHPPLLAAGSVVAGSWLARRRWAWWGALAWAAVGGALLLPMGIPLLPPAPMARYSETLGMTRAVTTNRGTTLPLPQDYADMLGWREQVAEVARVYRRATGTGAGSSRHPRRELRQGRRPGRLPPGLRATLPDQPPRGLLGLGPRRWRSQRGDHRGGQRGGASAHLRGGGGSREGPDAPRGRGGAGGAHPRVQRGSGSRSANSGSG